MSHTAITLKFKMSLLPDKATYEAEKYLTKMNLSLSSLILDSDIMCTWRLHT